MATAISAAISHGSPREAGLRRRYACASSGFPIVEGRSVLGDRSTKTVIGCERQRRTNRCLRLVSIASGCVGAAQVEPRQNVSRIFAYPSGGCVLHQFARFGRRRLRIAGFATDGSPANTPRVDRRCGLSCMLLRPLHDETCGGLRRIRIFKNYCDGEPNSSMRGQGCRSRLKSRVTSCQLLPVALRTLDRFAEREVAPARRS